MMDDRRTRRAPSVALLVLVPLVAAGFDLPQEAAAGHRIMTAASTLALPVWAAGTAWDGANLYTFGGLPFPDRITRYTPSTDTAVVLEAKLPQPLYYTAAVWAGDVAYIIGGRDALAQAGIWRFDPVGEEITRAGELPLPMTEPAVVWDPRDRVSAGCPGGCVYIFGGDEPGPPLSDKIYQFSPETTLVTTMNARLPTGRDAAAAAWTGSVALVFGGAFTDEILRYDPVSDNLTRMAARLTSTALRAGAAWDGSRAYVFGGSNGVSQLTRISRYDPLTDTLVDLPRQLLPARQSPGVVWDGVGTFLAVGGESGVVLDAIVKFPPGPDHPPVAFVVPEPVHECINGRATMDLSSTGSFDPEGTPLTYTWWSPGDMTFSDPTTAKPSVSAPLGTTPVKLRVTSGSMSDTVTSVVLVVDTIPPRTTAAIEGPRGNTDWHVGPVDVTLSATDACGVAATFVSIDNAGAQEASRVNVPDDGVHSALFQSRDLGGNIELQQVVGFKIDTTPPDAAIVDPDEGRAYVNDIEDPADQDLPYTIVAGTKIVSASAFDATSGVERVEFLVNGVLRETVIAPGPYLFAWNAGEEALGTHILSARAFDAAGNNATAEMEVTTVPTTQQGVLRTADFGNACRVVLGPEQCDALEDTIEQLDPAPTVNLLREAIDEFLRECEETFSRTLCALLPDELPGGPATAPGRAPPERDRGDSPRDGAVAVGGGGEPE